MSNESSKYYPPKKILMYSFNFMFNTSKVTSKVYYYFNILSNNLPNSNLLCYNIKDKIYKKTAIKEYKNETKNRNCC